MKNLLITTDSFLPRYDGIAIFLEELLSYLIKYYNVTVIAPKFGKYKAKNFKLIQLELSNIKIANYNPAKIDKNLIKNEIQKNDLIFVNTIGPIGSTSIIQAKKLNKKVINYVHSLDWELFSKATNLSFLENFFKTIVKSLYNKCDITIVPSLETLKELNKIDITTKIKIVEIGLDTKKFKIANKEKAKQKLKLKNKIVIIYVGRISKEKDLFTLKKAFKILKKEFSNLYLILIGDGDKKEIEELKDKDVKILSTKNVASYLNAADIYVLPSLTETSSLSTLEAMGCGLPVVCTKVGYIQSYLKNNYNGFLFEKHNTNNLVEILRRLIKNKNLRLKIGRNARKTVERFSWEKTALNLKNIFDRV